MTDQRNTPASHRWFVRLDDVSMHVVAACPTPEAAEAARRLLSGECERAKELEPPMYSPADHFNEGYEYGRTCGAAQERARIAAILRASAPFVGSLHLIAEVERGEAHGD